MMDSSNLDLQLQEDLHGSSSTSLHFLGRNHEWNHHDLLLNSGHDCIPNANVVLSSSREFMRLVSPDETPPPPLTPHNMVQDLGFQWNGNAADQSYINQQAHLSKIKEELSDYHLLSSHAKNEQQANIFQATNGLQPLAGDMSFDAMSFGSFGRGSFSMVLPTANISSLTPPLSSPFAASLGMDQLHALDLLASAGFGRAVCQPSSLSNMALLREDGGYGFGQHWQAQAQGSSTSHHKMSCSASGVTETKRGNGDMEIKSSQPATKRPRFESRSSFAPFKVRKEKLGDRIAALQQLVAPFGKTDTASVLMEAIGYIKFLQDQVETLSVPYMRSSSSKKFRTQGASTEERDEPKLDLRSRGLCLVPLSCTSYVTNENGVWSPPNYRGGT